MPSSSTRALAIVLAILFFPLGMAIGGQIGFGLAIVTMIVNYDGLWRVRQLTFDRWWLADMPTWFTPDQRSWTDVVSAIVGILFACAGMGGGIFLWRWLVMRLGWMSAEEVEAYLKRASDS